MDVANRVEIPVRFSEVDAYGIVWHGRFVDWLEVARNHYAGNFGYDLMGELGRGYRAPMLELRLDFRQAVHFGDTVEIEIRTALDPRRVFAFDYRLRRSGDGALLARARTVQVLQGADGGLLLGWPETIHRLLAAMHDLEASLPPW